MLLWPRLLLLLLLLPRSILRWETKVYSPAPNQEIQREIILKTLENIGLRDLVELTTEFDYINCVKGYIKVVTL